MKSHSEMLYGRDRGYSGPGSGYGERGRRFLTLPFISYTPMKTLETLFLAELADMYDAEHRLVKALPKMAGAATHAELKAAFQAHLTETEGHVKKVELVFQAFGKEAKPMKCEATVGLLKEADEIAEDNEGEPTLNAGLISAAQKVEHYEIASYGCLRTWAELLGNQRAAKLLGEILAQEKAADETLTLLAIKACNPAAEGAEAAKHASESADAPTEVSNGTGSVPEKMGVRRMAGSTATAKAKGVATSKSR
jgi:ferritin-like metal-binding protein YciE